MDNISKLEVRRRRAGDEGSADSSLPTNESWMWVVPPSSPSALHATQEDYQQQSATSSSITSNNININNNDPAARSSSPLDADITTNLASVVYYQEPSSESGSEDEDDSNQKKTSDAPHFDRPATAALRSVIQRSWTTLRKDEQHHEQFIRPVIAKIEAARARIVHQEKKMLANAREELVGHLRVLQRFRPIVEGLDECRADLRAAELELEVLRVSDVVGEWRVGEEVEESGEQRRFLSCTIVSMDTIN